MRFNPFNPFNQSTPMKRPLLLLSLLALALLALAAYETLSMDGLRGLLGTLVMDDNTVYAAGYSDRAFRRVRPGMGPDEVRGLLGDPVGCHLRVRDAQGRFAPDHLEWFPWSPDCAEQIAADPARLERLCYSDSDPRDASFRRCDILFENGTVVRPFAEFYGN